LLFVAKSLLKLKAGNMLKILRKRNFFDRINKKEMQ